MTTTQEQIQNVREWIARLLSSEYEQTTGMLRWADGAESRYCCLGVAIDPVVDDWPERLDVHSGGLYPDEEERFGLTNRQASALAQINDKGATFESIAIVLREWHLPMLRAKHDEEVRAEMARAQATKGW